jgi:hypothetical protein
MRRPVEMARRHRGFALVLVLGLVAIVGVLSAGSLQEALFGQALAVARQLQQRAASLADIGMAGALTQLAAAAAPADYTRELQPLPTPSDSVVVTQRTLGSSALPAGYSSGRFIARHYEIQAQGRSARGTRALQVQGVRRVLPADAAGSSP